MKSNITQLTKSKISIAVAASLLVISSALADEQSKKIERIEVTAQKRVQNIQEVPIAITAFSGDEIDAMGLNTSSDLSEKTPNLTIGQPTGEGGVVAIAIRGVGLSDFAPNNQAPIGMYVDGVVAGNSNAQITTLFDVERVEVLKGPQGTLYGKNTTGGTINIISRKPTDYFEGYFKVNLANYNTRKVEGAISGSLSDTLNARLSFVDYHSDGWTENLITNNTIEKNNQAYRLLLDWSVSNDTSVLFNIHGNENDSDADLYNASTDADFYKGASEFDPKINVKTKGASITIESQINENISFFSITSYDELDKFHQEDVDLSSLDVLRTQYQPETESFTQELRLSGQFGKATWILGAFYSKDEIDYDQWVRLFGDYEVITGIDLDGDGEVKSLQDSGPYRLQLDYDNYQESTTKAIFGQIDYNLSEALLLTVGLRLTQEKVELRSNATAHGLGLIMPAELGGLGLPIELVPDLILPGFYAAIGGNDMVDASGTYNDKTDETKPSGKIGLNWYVSPNTMLYGNYSHGFKGGGINGNFIYNPQALSSYEPESMSAFELGFKTDLLDETLRINAATFYYDYQDAQIFNNLPDPTLGLPIQRIINSDTSLYGFDAELQWVATDKLFLQASLGYT